MNNLIKFVLDALQLKSIFDNDVQVAEVRGRKVFGAEEYLTEIKIYRHELLVEEFY